MQNGLRWWALARATSCDSRNARMRQLPLAPPAPTLFLFFFRLSSVLRKNHGRVFDRRKTTDLLSVAAREMRGMEKNTSLACNFYTKWGATDRSPKIFSLFLSDKAASAVRETTAQITALVPCIRILRILRILFFFCYRAFNILRAIDVQIPIMETLMSILGAQNKIEETKVCPEPQK